MELSTKLLQQLAAFLGLPDHNLLVRVTRTVRTVAMEDEDALFYVALYAVLHRKGLDPSAITFLIGHLQHLRSQPQRFGQQFGLILCDGKWALFAPVLQATCHPQTKTHGFELATLAELAPASLPVALASINLDTINLGPLRALAQALLDASSASRPAVPAPG